MKTCISSSGRKIKVKYFAISRSAEKKNKNLGCHKKNVFLAWQNQQFRDISSKFAN